MKRTILALILLVLILIQFAALSNAEAPPFTGVEIQFPSFYEMNISGAMAKNIGVVGIQYTGRINITNFDKIDKRSLDDTFIYFTFDKLYSEFNYSGVRTYIYNENGVDGSFFNDSVSLSKCKECVFHDFSIVFLQIGTYVISWKINASGRMSDPTGSMISIVSPIEYENLNKQKALADSQLKASEASKKTAEETRKLVWATIFLAIITLCLGIATVCLGRQTKKSTEAIAKSNSIAVQPSVSCDIRSGVGQMEKLRVPIDEAVKKELCYNVNTLIINYTKFPANVTINLNLKVNNEVIKRFDDLYTGVKHWNIAPNRRFQGVFSLESVLNENGYDIAKLKDEQKKMKEERQDGKKQITMEVVVELHPEIGEPKSYLQSKYSFDFDKCKWFDVNYNYYV